MKKEEKKEVKKLDTKTMIEIEPKEDFDLNCPPHFVGQLKKGVKIEIPEFLKPNLLTEGIL